SDIRIEVWLPVSGWNEKFVANRSEEHTSELQSRPHLVCRLLLEKRQEAPGQRHYCCQDKNDGEKDPTNVGGNTENSFPLFFLKNAAPGESPLSPGQRVLQF